MRGWWAAIASVFIVAACTRPPAPLTEFHDPEYGFTVRYPPGWVPIRRAEAVWFVPPDHAPEEGEFILVVTRSADAQLDDAAIRRAVFEQLSIHGVSGFQQDTRTTQRVRWYKFEVTGSSGGPEWASVGAVSAGDARYHLVVCAKPLAQWRGGQKQCDEVVRTFQPSPLQ
jgi:predicted Zn-dependent protease